MKSSDATGQMSDDARDESAETLTSREREILGMFAEGLANKTVATELWISEETVKTHAKSIYRKLGVSGRVQAILVYLGHTRDEGGD